MRSTVRYLPRIRTKIKSPWDVLLRCFVFQRTIFIALERSHFHFLSQLHGSGIHVAEALGGVVSELGCRRPAAASKLPPTESKVMAVRQRLGTVQSAGPRAVLAACCPFWHQSSLRLPLPSIPDHSSPHGSLQSPFRIPRPKPAPRPGQAAVPTSDGTVPRVHEQTWPQRSGEGHGPAWPHQAPAGRRGLWHHRGLFREVWREQPFSVYQQKVRGPLIPIYK